MSDLLGLMNEAIRRMPAPLDKCVWVVNPTARRQLRRLGLAFRKGWPSPRRYRKSVHRAYRNLGVFP